MIEKIAAYAKANPWLMTLADALWAGLFLGWSFMEEKHFTAIFFAFLGGMFAAKALFDGTQRKLLALGQRQDTVMREQQELIHALNAANVMLMRDAEPDRVNDRIVGQSRLQ